MAESPTCLSMGAGGGVAGISPQVVTQLLSSGKAGAPGPTRGVALLGAPAHMDTLAGSNADTYRRRWWGRGRKVLRQRRIVGRRRDIGVDRIGNVGAPADRNTSADAGADVGVGHTGGLHDGIYLRNRRKSQHRYPHGSPRPQPQIHRDLLPVTAERVAVYSSAFTMRPQFVQQIALAKCRQL